MSYPINLFWLLPVLIISTYFLHEKFPNKPSIPFVPTILTSVIAISLLLLSFIYKGWSGVALFTLAFIFGAMALGNLIFVSLLKRIKSQNS